MKSIILFFLLWAAIAEAQNDSSKIQAPFVARDTSFALAEGFPDLSFVKLKTGKMYAGRNLYRDARAFGTRKFTLDDKEFKIGTVAFYYDGAGLYYHAAGGFMRSYANSKGIYFFSTGSSGVTQQPSAGNGYSSGNTSGGGTGYFFCKGIEKGPRRISVSSVKAVIPPNSGEASLLMKKSKEARGIGRVALAVMMVSWPTAAFTEYTIAAPVAIGGLITACVMATVARRMAFKALYKHTRVQTDPRWCKD